jgi:hypothetical protein
MSNLGKKVLLYRTDISGKTPNISDVAVGELALNYNSNSPFLAFKDTNKCERFSFPDKIELTNNLNDIIDRTQKHSNCYYYHEGDLIYDKLKLTINNTQGIKYI